MNKARDLKRTPLYEQHLALGAKMVPFAGWEMPVQYSGVIPEHHATRRSAGVFDVSHMGEIFVEGRDAEKFLSHIACNDVTVLGDNRAQYSALLNDKGGVIDDIIIYRFNSERYLICVNASNADRDFEWMQNNRSAYPQSKNGTDLKLTNQSAEFGQIALQGPKALDILSLIIGIDVADSVAPFSFFESEIAGVRAVIARTGYTGEDGAEIFAPWRETAQVWESLFDSARQLSGGDKVLQACGLGARDSLRLEACYPLHGHELGEDISALESGLGWIVKFDKPNFIGKQALLIEKQSGLKRRLAAFVIEDAGIARHGDKTFSPDGEEIGFVTSGTKTPTLNKAVGLALLKEHFAKEGSDVLIDVRGKRLKAKTVKKPLYRRAML